MKNSFLLSFLFLTTLLSVSCEKRNTPKILEDLDFSGGIFSNRPQNQNSFIAIVKLPTPALLESAQTAEGKLVFNADQLQAIQKEQQGLVDSLQKVSREIQILYRYKMVLNGVAISAPKALFDRIKGLGQISYFESEGQFGRPIVKKSKALAGSAQDLKLREANSVKWIGSEELHKKGIKGKGIKVGIIDTGIDYTHSMLGGPGDEAVFKAIQPSEPSPLFPNKKVVGGLDFVGTEFNSSSGDARRRIPKPDLNPLDEGGHGTHVAGTVAGVGDGEKTYDGVAPDADLYALKVFGAEGSTSDTAVVAALEYAADPQGDGSAKDRLDVVNLSLGSAFGTPHMLYAEAVRNLTRGGTVVVASAGNEGPEDYIVGAPSVVDDAISVAASVDNAFHNWNFNAIKFRTASQGEILTEAIEGPISKPVAEAGEVTGSLVFVGLADVDFSEELKAQLKGKVALVDRGKVNFTEKVRRSAEAGAIGVVVVNSDSTDPFAMGGDGKWEIPAVMIKQSLGDVLKAEMKKGDVVLQFQNAEKIQKPELIDTIAGFSSKGPRTQDGHLKPEISAPGENVISADMGKGKAGVAMSGTSMAGPHVAGVMALLREVYPQLSAKDLKSIVMGRSLTLKDADQKKYPISRQGAGRAQVDRAAQSALVSDQSSISFGDLNIESRKLLRTTLSLRNISKTDLDVNLKFVGVSEMSMKAVSAQHLKAGQNLSLNLDFIIDGQKLKESSKEFEGLVLVMKGEEEIFRVPVLAVVRKVSQIQATGLKVFSTSENDAAHSLAEVFVENKGQHAGKVLPFNLLARDTRKENQGEFMDTSCDLQAAGYRIVEKVIENEKVPVLQVSAKLYDSVTSWHTCELVVLIDANGDDTPEQELAFTAIGSISGLGRPADEYTMASVLLDAGKTREIRRQYEIESEKPDQDPKKPPVQNYLPAVLYADVAESYNHSSIAVVEVPVSLLQRQPTGELSLKVATSFQGSSSTESDDFLANGLNSWTKISTAATAAAFYELPESVAVQPGEKLGVSLTKGEGRGELLLLFPENRSVKSDVEEDFQSAILKPEFVLP